jgi:ketosteroid isomerase-like protein
LQRRGGPELAVCGPRGAGWRSSVPRVQAEQVVRAVFAAFAARDVEAAVALADPELSFHPQGTSQRVGNPSPYVGHEGLRRYFADVETVWRELEVFPDDLRVAGAGVIAFGTARGTTHEGERMEQPVIWVFKLRGGRICSVQAVGSPGEAQRAVA